jgi:transcriptional regulator with XRE-family HTH domain
MDTQSDVREFLTSRRARITPQQAGLAIYGDSRRVPGLRRSEVAALSGMSVEYYTRLERGNLSGVSEQVLDALARALQLDEAERGHLFDLARAASPGVRRSPRRLKQAKIRPSIYRVLEALTASPAYVRNARMDILAVNDLARALYGDILAREALPLNLARFLFFDPRAREFFLEWDTVADEIADALRIEAGRHPFDRDLTDLIGELAARSSEFGIRWARHNVRLHRTVVKRLHNKLVGDIELTGDALEIVGEDLTLIAYTAKPDSHAQQQLNFLASWAAAPDHRAASVGVDSSEELSPDAPELGEPQRLRAR